MLFESDQPVAGSGGRVTLWANDRLIGEGEMAKTVPLAFTSYAGMDISRDNGLVVDRDYEDRAPYAFTGTVKEVVFDLKPVHRRSREGVARARVGPSRRAGRRGLNGRAGPTEPERSRARRTGPAGFPDSSCPREPGCRPE